MSKKRFLILALCLFMLTAAIAVVATAESTGSYSIPWWTVDDGGSLSTAGPYTLSGTIGQPDVECMAAEDFKLRSGYWQSCQTTQIFLPLTTH